ncbi:hypothetical protein [Roseiflexus sp.]|uniref:hypothetical protein n=1 Tax=Roseiflexus sp. TaxID=2562120 RepID=UPI0021DD5071|nr:hypothetical protein [Roseiflexus sp.]GIV99902.1 MAG: hypothetical protein KatS3mg058_1306 [Roseiflexus sp.]
MSYQERQPCGPVVVCDCCGSIGAIGDCDWRQVRGNGIDDARHLCRACRRRAVWCEVHQTYHLPETFHRRPCIACGGLFTAQVALNLEYCPSCRRERGILVSIPAQARNERKEWRMWSWLFPWRALRRHRSIHSNPHR